MLKTKIVISSGDAYADLFYILANKDVCKISITHGFGPKTDQLRLNPNLIARINRFSFVNFPSKHTCEK